ncbi:MAG: TonB-dependent receptor [Bryobacterales bacterium]|nr:TonB-dependent receptor [Bryobacterales bacterium]
MLQVSFLFLLGLCLHAQDTAGVGALKGKVTDAAGALLPGAQVCLKDTGRCATADDTAHFQLTEIRAGEYRIEVSLPGQPGIASGAIVVHAGLEATVEVTLPKIDATQQSVTVTESAFVAPEEIKSSAFLVQPVEISKSAGALQDVARYVQTLPGVAIGSDDFRNDIIVRGGSPLENLFVVDNIEIPNINSFANFASAGGTVSILDAGLIQDVTFLTGGYPAPYINRVSSVLQVAQREGSREQFGGRATLGFAGAGAILEGPIKKGKGSWIVSARRSFLDLFTNDVGFGGVPVLYTFNAKALYDLSPRDRIWGVTISGVDKIRLGATEDSDPDEEISNFDIRYNGWRSATGFNWQRLFGTRGVGLLGVTHSEARLTSSVRDLIRSGKPLNTTPVDEVLAASPVVYRDDSREGESTIKYDLTAYAPIFDKIQAGGSYKIFQIRYDSASPLGNDSPYSRVPGLNSFALARDFRAYQQGAYFQATRPLAPKLSLTWGGRLDRYPFIGKSRFSPRLGLSYRITDKLSWRGTYGTYFQQPFFLFLSAFDENRGLNPFRAGHVVTGFTYIASSTLRFTVEGYVKNYKDYPVALQFPSLSLANLGDTFNVRETLFPLTSAGRGRVRGVEFFLEKKFSEKWFGQANFSVSRTRHSALDGVYRPGNFDYPYIFNAVGGYRLTGKWELSTRFAYLGGRPFTPFDIPVSTAQGRGIFDLQRVNAERAPDYVRLDIRADRTFTVREKPLLVFVGVQNILNRKNFAGYIWNRRLNEPKFNEQLGAFPLIGMEWRF